jgi:hypothetical protein
MRSRAACIALAVVFACTREAPAPPAKAHDAAIAIDAVIVDAAPVDAAPADAASNANADAAVPVDAAIEAPPAPAKRKKPAKSARMKCLEDCRRRNMTRHCADAEGMTDCPCNCR